MHISVIFTRTLFLILNALLMTSYLLSVPEGDWMTKLGIGVGGGFLIGLVLITLDLAFKQLDMRSFNSITLGLFFGYLMAQGLDLIFKSFLDMLALSSILPGGLLTFLHSLLFISVIYLSVLITLRSSQSISLTIPFIQFTSEGQKDLIASPSALADSRLIDLALTGLIDHKLLIPRFLVKEFQAQTEIGEEANRNRARRALEVLKRLETLPDLNLRYHEKDYPEIKESSQKISHMARTLNLPILTSELSKAQVSLMEGIRYIDIHALSNALKPLMQTGEELKIKIQRYGKEPRQGIGYLEDGSMVVVNGGGDYIGETIEVRVLSVKHTTTGRIIFCNAMEEESLSHALGEHSQP
jgi:uncharacterized protein YacL